MVKRLLRAAVRKTKRWLEDAPAIKTKNNQVNNNAEQSRYDWLNNQWLKILEQDKRRPDYVWGVVHAAGLAQALGIRHISVIEFGVAGGNGLMALDDIAAKVRNIFHIEIDVYGFDTGVGLPKPTDYRDLPNLFSEGFYPMDPERLQKRLKKAKLILGLVEDTVPQFVNSGPAPVAFTAFDLDLYSSTKHALALFTADQKLLLPRIHCYFDDILGYTYSEFTGELLAISEFNACQKMRKISKFNALRYYVPSACRAAEWVESMYMAHVFDHELYGVYDRLNSQTTCDMASEESRDITAKSAKSNSTVGTKRVAL